MSMVDYKALNLKRECIDEYVNDFADKNELSVRSIEYINDNKIKRVVIGKVGIENSTVDIYLNANGTTTLKYKVGKNQELGEHLVQHIYRTIDPAEFENVNITLIGIYTHDIDPIFDELANTVNDDARYEFQLNTQNDDEVRKQIRISSNNHQDSLVVSHFKTTNKLTIQGRPLFCYRRLTYLISELLDLAGLQSVLSRTDENTAAIVRAEIAEDYLQTQLSNCFDKLPNTIRQLLVSGCCVKLASPQLPEYSMLLFPDLRALEGVLRTVLSNYGMYVDDEANGFGAFFDVNSGLASLNEQFHANVKSDKDLINALELGYSFFRKHRNTLFHMNDFADASRRVDTLGKALDLSKNTYSTIDRIYGALT